MPVSTLSLGSVSYQLLDDLGATAVIKGNNTLISSEYQIADLSIGNNSQTNSNVTIKAEGIQNFTADLGVGNDALNIIGDVENASILFGQWNPSTVDSSIFVPGDSGSNRLDIRGNLGDINSKPSDRNQIAGAAGNDSFKISGSVVDTNFYMAAGNDSLIIGGAAVDVYANTGSGNDLVEFRGTTNNIIVQTDSGNDTVIFRNELIGEDNYDDVTAAVELGAGNDSLTLANGASYAEINTGSGKDILRLTGSFTNTEFYLSGPKDTLNLNTGDSISISSNSIFENSSFSSNNTLGDTLIVGSNSLWINSDIYFADGNDSLVFGSNATFTDSMISLGGGNDTLVFGSSTMFRDTTIDLGDDDFIDVVRFSSQDDYNDVEFIGYDDTDIYYIGATQYTFGDKTPALS